MRTRPPVFFLSSLLLACLLLPQWAVAAPSSKARQKELDKVQQRIQALNQTLERDRQQREALDADMEAAEKNLLASRNERKRIVRELAGRQAELLRAQTERDSAAEALATERAALGKELRATYITGQREQAKLLLSQDSAGPVGRLLTYQDYLNRARADRVTRLHAEEQRLKTAEAQLKGEATKLGLLRDENRRAIAEDIRLRAERATLLARLNDRIDDEEARLKSLLQDERDLVRVLDSIKSALADEPVKTPAGSESDGTPARAFGKGRGKMGWPLRGTLLANYGDPKVGGKLAWKGLWIAAERGDTVRASARGRVAYAGFMHRFGLIVILEHEDNHFTLYGHLDNVAVAGGDTVALGEMIGQVGDSGGHERTGVYFEVRKGTDPLDPRSWLQP